MRHRRNKSGRAVTVVSTADIVRIVQELIFSAMIKSTKILKRLMQAYCKQTPLPLYSNVVPFLMSPAKIDAIFILLVN